MLSSKEFLKLINLLIYLHKIVLPLEHQLEKKNILILKINLPQMKDRLYHKHRFNKIC